MKVQSVRRVGDRPGNAGDGVVARALDRAYELEAEAVELANEAEARAWGNRARRLEDELERRQRQRRVQGRPPVHA